MQGRGGGARAELPLEWEGCMSMPTQAEVEVRGGVETGVSSSSFARPKIQAPGEAEGLVENDGG